MTAYRTHDGAAIIDWGFHKKQRELIKKYNNFGMLSPVYSDKSIHSNFFISKIPYFLHSNNIKYST